MSMNKTWAISSWISFLTSADIQSSEERDSLKELQRYIGKKKKTPNAQRPTPNVQCRSRRTRVKADTPIEHPESRIQHRLRNRTIRFRELRALLCGARPSTAPRDPA